MPAYIVVDVTINNSAEYEEYKRLTPASIAAYGGRFVVRGAATESLQGNWGPQRLVILEFPSVAIAKEWWASEEYAPAKAIRQQNANTKMLVVDGYNP